MYSNAIQDATLTVRFTSPLGETSEVSGFWDGGRVWRARFSPNLPGRWTFKTTCSDSANEGLANQTGEFLCSAAIGPNRFHQHGPVQVARDHRHLEHADGTPFFWLADTAWNGARMSAPKDWDLYAKVRASQDFTVAQWSVAPGMDAKNQAAFTGSPERIAINPDFFKRLDAKLERLSQGGILSAIVPLSEMEAEASAVALSDDQAVLLVRYVVARWGAEPVAWLLAVEGDSKAKNIERWKKIGRAVFAGRQHAPVVLFPGRTPWLLDEFASQEWVDVFGFQSVTDLTDDALKWTFAGPFPREWARQPARPLIPFAPYENGVAAQSKKRFSSDDVRHAVYWSLFLAPPAGISYGGQGVANWDMAAEPKKDKTPGAGMPLWQKAMFMPAAKQMYCLGQFVNSMDFWRLRPQPNSVSAQPGELSPRRYIAAAATESKDLAVVYVPEERTVELALDALPPSPRVTWFNPRTGQSSPAVAVVSGSICQFPTPEPGDWVLVMRAGK